LDFELFRARPPDVKHFGDAEAVFRVGTLLLRLVRDRGQEFMDLATSATPDKFHQFDDVVIAMGWKTIDEVLAKREPEPLSQTLARLSQHFAELAEAFSGEGERFTLARVERAARDRGDAFMGRLQGNQQG
jgi:hypothetical protein